MHKLAATFFSISMGVVLAACGDSSATGGSTGNGTGGAGNGTGTSTNNGGTGGLGSTGSFMDGSTGTQMGCNPQTFTLEQAPPPEVYLVVDRSGSMLLPGASANSTRWDELKSALDAALASYESQIRFGLIMYPRSDAECGTEGPQVLFGPDNRLAINTELGTTTPAGGTPTAAALNNAAASLQSLGTAGTPKFLILATDGGPNCNYFVNPSPACSCTYAATMADCCTNTPGACPFGSSCLDDAGTLDVIGDQHAAGIDTFVIGLNGTQAYVSLLDAMADAGGRPQLNAATKYYAASNEAAMLAALDAIAVSVISCEIQLTQAPDKPDAVSVYVDGVVVPQDMTHTNGWDYTDASNTSIELFGVACEDIQDGAMHDVTATFECEVM